LAPRPRGLIRWEPAAIGAIVVGYLLANAAITVMRPGMVRAAVSDIGVSLARDQRQLDRDLAQWRQGMAADGRWVAALVAFAVDERGAVQHAEQLEAIAAARLPTARVWVFDRRGAVRAQLAPDAPSAQHAALALASLRGDTTLLAATEVRGGDLRLAVASPLRTSPGADLVIVLDRSAASCLPPRLPGLDWAGHAARAALDFPFGHGFVGVTWTAAGRGPSVGWPAAGWSLMDTSLIAVYGEMADSTPRFELGIARELAWSRAESRMDWLRAMSTIIALGLVLGVVLAGRAGRARRLRATERSLAESHLRAAQAEAAATRAGLAAVQARLHPHFLSNALHSVAALISSDPAAAEEAVDRLGDLFRYSMEQSARASVVLEREWRFVEDYLAIERMRLGSRLAVEMALDPAVTASEVPSFVLQPLVENAIRHGVGPRRLGGTVRVSARRTGGGIELNVSDDGVGADPSAVQASSGTGIRTLRQRLALDPAFTGHVDIETAPNAGFRVRVTIGDAVTTSHH